MAQPADRTMIARRTVLRGGLGAGAALMLATPGWAQDRCFYGMDLIGDYGEPERFVTIGEADGALFAIGMGLDGMLTPAEPGVWRAVDGRRLYFSEGGQSVVINGLLNPRRDFGAEAQARIRAAVRADPAALRQRALAATPPAPQPGARAADLVALTGVGLRLDIRYATADNFMGLPVYDRPGAFLQRPAAEALGRVLAALRAQGFGLVIYDAYRPWYATWMFWEATPPESREFVADPAQGSRHNRGCAVDLGLTELATGRIVPMPSRYDEFSHRAAADFRGGTSEARANRDLLRRAMEAEGFAVIPEEWWHFDHATWRDYPVGTATFAELGG